MAVDPPAPLVSSWLALLTAQMSESATLGTSLGTLARTANAGVCGPGPARAFFFGGMPASFLPPGAWAVPRRVRLTLTRRPGRGRVRET